MTYLRNRLSERSTWVGIAIFVAALALLWIFRQQILAGLTAAVAGCTMAATPSQHIATLIRALLAPIRPGIPAQPQGKSDMSIAATLSQLATNAPTVLKLVSDGVAVEADLKANGIAALSNPATMTFLADVEKLVAAITPAAIPAPAPQE